MDNVKGIVVSELCRFFGDDYARITHALEVMRHAEQLAAGHDDIDYDVLIAVALLHDVGIKVSEEKLGYNDGKTQEQFGPAAAAEILARIGFPTDDARRVCDMVGNHHSPSRYEYPELVVLKKADGIVNRGSSA